MWRKAKESNPQDQVPVPVFETGRVTRRTAFQSSSVLSRMQDSNPRHLVTRQVLFPVELIRQALNVWLARRCTPGGNRTRDRHVISVPHQPSVLPALWTSRGARGGIRTRTVRFRKPELYPLSYAGFIGAHGANCGRFKHPRRESNSQPPAPRTGALSVELQGFGQAPLAGFEPATVGTENRCAIRCATRALGRSGELNPRLWSHNPPCCRYTTTATKLLPRSGSACGGGGTRTPNRVSRGGSLAPSCITVLPHLRVENRGVEPLASCLQSRRSSN